MSTLWTTSQVAEYLGYTGKSATGSARRQLSRWGVTPVRREPGRGGESLYEAEKVKKLHEGRLGSGRRGAARSGGRFTKQGLGDSKTSK
ncbi:hypothetical protein [Streptomyces bacillaris]|uniref:hypothetical protein n=1 Tax=Streptomyces bacillaris TaxID=68179 RepID=UPI0036345F74